MKNRIVNSINRIALFESGSNIFFETRKIIQEGMNLLNDLSLQLSSLSEEKAKVEHDVIIIGMIVLSLAKEIELFKTIGGFDGTTHIEIACKLNYLYPKSSADLLDISGLTEVEEEDLSSTLGEPADLSIASENENDASSDSKAKMSEIFDIYDPTNWISLAPADRLAKANELCHVLGLDKKQLQKTAQLKKLIPIIGYKVLIERTLSFDANIFWKTNEFKIMFKDLISKSDFQKYMSAPSSLLLESLQEQNELSQETALKAPKKEKKTSTPEEEAKQREHEKLYYLAYQDQVSQRKRYRYLGRAAAIFAGFIPLISLPFMIYKEIDDRQSNIKEPIWKTILRCALCGLLPFVSGFAVWKWTAWFEKKCVKKEDIQKTTAVTVEEFLSNQKEEKVDREETKKQHKEIDWERLKEIKTPKKVQHRFADKKTNQEMIEIYMDRYQMKRRDVLIEEPDDEKESKITLKFFQKSRQKSAQLEKKLETQYSQRLKK